ncbi:MAG: hypothetical protein DLM55_09645 [Acidimicrobiales bacterium]|nr:MAG: hypothetical protein DLM55_09645 [Acidimicrobiales bacterium]PZS31714.1 MAG: hypothetical protein DLM59_09505 [Pseudonocardiales bacterium]
MNNVTFLARLDRSVTPEEIKNLQYSVGWSGGDLEDWLSCIGHSLCVATARDISSNELVGIGFLAGNVRHAQLVDLTVHPRVQRHGVARQLVQLCLGFVVEHGIKYVGLTWAESSPWLKDFYFRAGFREIHNAMWLEESIIRANAPVLKEEQ